MGKENNTYGINEKPKGPRPSPPPAPPNPGCFNPIVTPAPPTTNQDLLEYYRLQLYEEKKSREYYQTIVYDVCNIIDEHRDEGGRVVCGTVNSPSYQVQDKLSDMLDRLEFLKIERMNNGV